MWALCTYYEAFVFINKSKMLVAGRKRKQVYKTLWEKPQALKATCIWKFVQRQPLHLGFCWRYHRILFGYQARIFHFPFFNVSHKILSFMTWNLIEYLHTQDFQSATAHLNVWTTVLSFCFVYGCKQHTKMS